MEPEVQIDDETGLWIARDPEFDLVTSAETEVLARWSIAQVTALHRSHHTPLED